MRDLEELAQFARRRTESEDLVLCTLVRKHGSSYRAAGAKKIIAREMACGTLSGGCMEGAIERTARARQNEMPFIESFSTMSDEDRLMGYQTGCQGRIEVLFEKVNRGASEEAVENLLAYGPRPPAEAVSISLRPDDLGRRDFVSLPTVPAADTFLDPWIEPLHVTVIGCGPDSEPYIDLAAALGWKISFADYRGDLVDHFRSLTKNPVAQWTPAELSKHIPCGKRSAVVLATHNYEADLEILKGLVKLPLGYVGCLGPQARWERLKRDLVDFHDLEITDEWESHLHAPAGIFARGRSPGEIALSVVAQIQGVLNERVAENDRENFVKNGGEKLGAHDWTLILAAGEARRFGSPKALAKFHGGQSLLARMTATARAATGKHVAVVTGAHRAPVETEIDPTVLAVHNAAWKNGMGASIACGIAAIREQDPLARLVLIAPVDQPLVTAAHLRRLIDLSLATGRCVLTSDDQRSGPPAALPRRLFDLACGLSGDHGLKAILRPSDVVCIHAPNELRDADRPAELGEIRAATFPPA